MAPDGHPQDPHTIPEERNFDSPRAVTRQIDRLELHSRSSSPSAGSSTRSQHIPVASATVSEIAETPDCRRGVEPADQESPDGESPSKRRRTGGRRDESPLRRVLWSEGQLRSGRDGDALLRQDLELDRGTGTDSQNGSNSQNRLDSENRDENEHEHEEPDIDRAQLTWQESEITGHEIDLIDTADDGEGINGLGFKPTARIAAQRVLKRRQQVNEYKAREASEMRSLRRERRMDGAGRAVGKASVSVSVSVSGSGSGSGGIGHHVAKRNVRFAEL